MHTDAHRWTAPRGVLVGNPLNFAAQFAGIEQQAYGKTCRLQGKESSRPGPVWRCTSIASPMTCSVNDSARSMRRPSVIPVVLCASSVRIEIIGNARARGRGGHEALLAATVALTDAIVRAVAIFHSHGGRAEDHGDHGGRGSHGLRPGNAQGFDATAWMSRWLNEPLAALGGVRPMDLTDTMEGQGVVSTALAPMQSGAYA